jgi:hypothetical protein
MPSWIRGVKLSLIHKSLFVLELILGEGFKTLKNFMSRSKKRLRKGCTKTSGKNLSLNNMTEW